MTGVRGRPKLNVVGYASPAAQDLTQQAWVVPAEITALEKAGAPAQEEMLYTFRHAATLAQVIALEGAVGRAVVSWQASRLTNVIRPPVPGFGQPPSQPGGAQPSASRPRVGHQQVAHAGHSPSRGPRAGLPPQLAQLGTHLARAYTPGALALLVLAGLAIAIVGALGPAIWAAAIKTTTALHAE